MDYALQTQLNKNLKNDYLKNKYEVISKFNLLTLKHTINNLINTLNIKDLVLINEKIISRRIEQLFNLNVPANQFQNRINYLYIIVKYFSKLIGFLGLKERSITSSTNVYLNDEVKYANIKKYLRSYYQKIKDLEFGEDKTKDSEKSDKFLKIQTVIEKIIKKLVMYSNDRFDFIVIAYGSFTSYNLSKISSNKELVTFNDIDIYHNYNFFFAISLQFLIKVLFDENITINTIPFISGHINIKFENSILTDILFIDTLTLQYLQKENINGYNFINPLFQFCNNIRMNCEAFRMYNIYHNLDSILVKNTYLLYFLDKKFNIKKEVPTIDYTSVKKNKKDDFPSYFIFKFNKFNLKNIFVFLRPDDLIEYVEKIDGKYSKKFHAFLNEIFFEDPLGNLYFTNYSTSVYLKESKFHEVNIQSIFSTVTLYSFLHQKPKALNLFQYFLTFLNLPLSNIKEYTLLPRLKLVGEHKSITIEPMHYTNINYYTPEKSEYLTKEEFQEIILKGKHLV